VFQALAAPQLDITQVDIVVLAEGVWRVDVGVANIGWLPTDVSALARKEHLVLPIAVGVRGDGVEVTGPARRTIGQLDGRAALRFRAGNDGTTDRTLVSWTL